MKEKTYKTRNEIVSYLKGKGFREIEKSNKNLVQLEHDNGNILVTVTTGAKIEIRDKGETVAQICQPIFDISFSDERIFVMTGSDGDKDWANFYFRRSR